MASITGLMASLEIAIAPENGKDLWWEGQDNTALDEDGEKPGSSIDGLGEASESALSWPCSSVD